MLRQRPTFSAILFILVAVTAGLALRQVGWHRLHASEPDSISASGTVQQLDPAACTSSSQAHVESNRSAPAASDTPSVVLRMNYAGTTALIDALERDSLSEADVDSLLRVPGLCAMVANVSRFIPAIGVPEFRKEIHAFARTRKRGAYDPYFGLSAVWQVRSNVRTLIAAIQTNERTMVAETISQLERYRPDTGSLAMTAYFVVGGVSTGFAFENDRRSFYANLVDADGDLNGIVLNMTHEAYHVMQFRAQERAGIVPLSVAADTTPPVARLFATTLAEGTASYAADPTRSTDSGSQMESARQRYRRNAEPKRIARNFALFDDVLMRLRRGRMSWDKAYTAGFTGANDESFYFVGYEMARALDKYCGRECIGRMFAGPPVEFFRRYVALCHEHPELVGHFSKETEAVIAAYGTTRTR